MHARMFVCLAFIILCLMAEGAVADSGIAVGEPADTLLHLSAADSTSLEEIKAQIKDGQYADAETKARELLAKVEGEHDSESLEAATVLDQLVESLWRGGKSSEPETKELGERAVAIKEKRLGPVHLSVAQSTHQLAIIYYSIGDYDKAEQLNKRTLKIRENVLGKDHVDVAKSLNNLAIVYESLGKYAERESHYKRALAIWEKALGPNDPAVAIGLVNLGGIYREEGRYAEAEPLFKRSLAITENTQGPEHPDVAVGLINLADLYLDQGKYTEADPLYRRALTIRINTQGPENPQVAFVLGRLAMLNLDQGKYTEAESLGTRALAIREKSLGPDHPYVAGSLGSLSFIYRKQAKYEKAIPLAERALAITQKAFSSDNPNIGDAMSNLSFLKLAVGEYSEAQSLSKRALAILENAFGPDHPHVADAIDNLADAYRFIGKHAEREALIKRSLAIREKAFGPEDLTVAYTLDDLATLHMDEGDYTGAESFVIRSMTIREKVQGPAHQEYGWSVVRLADIYFSLGRLSEAEPLYQQALAIWENALGANSSIVGSGLATLGLLYSRKGKFDEAERMLERALEIKEANLSPVHPRVAQVLEFYSEHYRRRGDATLALSMARRAIRIRQEHFENNAASLTERDAISFSQSLRASVDNYLSCYIELDVDDPQVVGNAADIILSIKGHVSDGIFKRRGRMVRLLAGTESLKLAKSRLSQLYVEGPGEDTSGYRSRLDSLANLVENLEANLAHSSGERQQDHTDISAERIAWRLPRQTALVEYVKYDFQGLDSEETAIPHYLVLVLDSDIKPVIMDLGEASEIETLVEQYRRHLLSISSLERAPTIVDLEEYRKMSRELYNKIWQPIEVYLSGSERIFVAPDGGLNMLSFAGLLGDDGTYLIEKHAIHYLSSGRDLIRLKDRSEPASGLFALGDPDYDADVMTRLSEPERSRDSTTEPVYYAATRNVRSGCGLLKELTIDPLPGTRMEVEQIAISWREASAEALTTYFGSDASEEKFKLEAFGNRVIHLATHGYFLEGTCQPVIHRSRISAETDYVGENPLLLSGLFFAGANLHGEGSDQEGAEDGILTAYEVSEMVLDGTELVVLSACETGLGEVKEGEGVYGLRRAFQMAGARTVISALWPVSDRITAEMMGQLYDRGDETLPERMRRIQLEKIQGLRARGEVDHPFIWGAFIALGDWR